MRRDIKKLGRDFNIFHACNLNLKNWRFIAPSYIGVIRKVFELIAESELKALIYIESQDSESPTVFLENEFQRARNGIQNIEVQKLVQSIDPCYFPVFTRCARHIKNYVLNSTYFGTDSQSIYYPEVCGSIEKYRCRSIHSGRKDIKFYDIISYFINEFSRRFISEMKTLGKADKNFFYTRYEPINKKGSRVVQCADILCNFFYSLVRYLIGISDDMQRKKALSLLGFDFIRKNKNNFRDIFYVKQNHICINTPEYRLFISRDYQCPMIMENL